MAGLTAKETLFVAYYLGAARFNGTEAARLAGFDGDANVLGVTAYRLLRKPKIAEAIRLRLTEAAMSADEVLARLADQARGDASDFITVYESPLRDELTGRPILDRDGAAIIRYYPLLNLEKARSRGVLHLVKKVSYTANGPAVELYDAQAALALLGKHHLLFNDTTLNIDMSRLSDEQVDRLAAGESLATVIRTTKKDAAPDPG